LQDNGEDGTSSLKKMRVERPLDSRNQSGKVPTALAAPVASAKAALPRLVVCGTRPSRGSSPLELKITLQLIISIASHA
jgi:hypothetical protein